MSQTGAQPSQTIDSAAEHPATSTHPCGIDYKQPEVHDSRQQNGQSQQQPPQQSQRNATTNGDAPAPATSSGSNQKANALAEEKSTKESTAEAEYHRLYPDSEDEDDAHKETNSSGHKQFMPIEEHGIIGNMRTCALISTDAQVNWFCYPHFDSPSIFGNILDPQKGGHYSIKVVTHRAAARAEARKKHNSKDKSQAAPSTIQSDYENAYNDELNSVNHFTTLEDDEQERKERRANGQPEDDDDHHRCTEDEKYQGDAGYEGSEKVSSPSQNVTHKQLYHSESNILVTRFLAKTGVAHVRDFMPVGPGTERAQGWLVREIEVVRGSMCFEIDCKPAFNYGRDPHETEISSAGAKFISRSSPHSNIHKETNSNEAKIEDAGLVMMLTSANKRKWRICKDGSVVCRLRLREGDRETFTFRSTGQQVDTDEGTEERGMHVDAPLESVREKETDQLQQKTIEYWRAWLSKCTYTGRWREYVHRSALVLKLLTFEPTGAMVSAPTTSLPNLTAGTKNHDYRYTWIRDSAFVIYSFIKLGFTDEARAFIKWSQRILKDARCEHMGTILQNMYGLHGEREITEETLDHWSGYRNSKPVRIGNTSYKQFQLDIYGVSLDTLYLSSKYAQPISWSGWQSMRSMVDWVCEHWTEPDHSIWGMHYADKSERPDHVNDELLGQGGEEVKTGVGRPEHDMKSRSRTLHQDVMNRENAREQQSALGSAGMKTKADLKATGESSVWNGDSHPASTKAVVADTNPNKKIDFQLTSVDNNKTSSTAKPTSKPSPTTTSGNANSSKSQLPNVPANKPMKQKIAEAEEQKLRQTQEQKEKRENGSVFDKLSAKVGEKLSSAAEALHIGKDKAKDTSSKNAQANPSYGCDKCHTGAHHDTEDDQFAEAHDRDRQQYTYSKLMCWVAVDRGIRIAQKRSLPADLSKWLYVRNAIYEYVLDKCWNEERQAFVQAAGSDKLDASVLLMPSFFFLTPTDPRFVSTVESIFQAASKGGLVSNNLVYRYSSSEKVDAATYSVCTFWAVEAASRLGMFDAKWLEKARLMFEQMLGYANHLRIFAEQVGLRGEHIGNFPHAFTHLSLISAALNLDRALSGSKAPYLTSA